jgi:hypothetical protein
MTSPAQPRDLNNHQRDTLRKLFAHPASHNIERRAVISLLEAVGSVEHRDDKVIVTIGTERWSLELPDKDIDIETVVDLRHILTAAGYASEAE